MAQEQVDGIIRAMIAGHQVQQQQQELQARQLELKQNKEYRDAQISNEHDRIDQEHKEFDLRNKMAQANSAWLLEQRKQEVADRLSNHQPVPGATLGSTGPADFHGGAMETYQLVDPDTKQPYTIQVPNIALHNSRLQAQEAAKDESRHQNTLSENSANRDAMLEQSRQTQLAETNRSNSVRQSTERIAAQQSATQRYIGQLNNGIGPDSEHAAEVSPLIPQFMDGTLTQEQGNQLIPKQGPRQAVFNALTKLGTRPVTAKEKATIQSFETTPDIFDSVDKLNELTKGTGGMLATQIPLTDAKAQAKALEDQINMGIPRVIGQIGDSMRSRQQIDLAMKPIMPDINPMSGKYETNVAKRNHALATLLHEQLKTMQGLPQPLQDAFLKNSKLHSINFLDPQTGKPADPNLFDENGNMGKQPAPGTPAAPGTPGTGGATLKWTPDGVVSIGGQ